MRRFHLSIARAQLREERYNLLNSYLATVPANHALNVRRRLITNANYSFQFTLHCGERENRHLRREYLAVLETNHHTPYFFNLHHSDTTHTLMLGRTGAESPFCLTSSSPISSFFASIGPILHIKPSSFSSAKKVKSFILSSLLSSFPRFLCFLA